MFYSPLAKPVKVGRHGRNLAGGLTCRLILRRPQVVVVAVGIASRCAIVGLPNRAVEPREGAEDMAVPALIAVNGGSSTLRAWLFYGTGAARDSRSAPRGILTVMPDGFSEVLRDGGWRQAWR